MPAASRWSGACTQRVDQLTPSNRCHALALHLSSRAHMGTCPGDALFSLLWTRLTRHQNHAAGNARMTRASPRTPRYRHPMPPNPRLWPPPHITQPSANATSSSALVGVSPRRRRRSTGRLRPSAPDGPHVLGAVCMHMLTHVRCVVLVHLSHNEPAGDRSHRAPRPPSGGRCHTP